MAHLHFTPQLRRFVQAPALAVDAPTVQAALDAAFVVNPRLWGAIRKGLFELHRGSTGWQVATAHFLAEPVSRVLPPAAAGGRMANLRAVVDDAQRRFCEIRP